jgi:hypothetical protein
MSTPGRPKGECRSAQHEGTPVSVDVVMNRSIAAVCAAALPRKSDAARRSNP